MFIFACNANLKKKKKCADETVFEDGRCMFLVG